MADIPANFRPGAFAGAAEAYARYRPPYPRRMLDHLLARAGIGRGGVLLDLASGPGRIALDLAGSFDRVAAVDIEPDMVAVGRAEAARRGIENVTFELGRAEDFEAPPASFDLVTIGEAFHRLEPRIVATKVFAWLKPGRCLATLGTDNRFSGEQAWEVALRDVRDRWLPRAFPGGWGTVLPGGALDQADREAVLRAAGFVEIEEHTFEEELEFGFDKIVGYLASSSVCSRRVLGADFDAWAADLQAAVDADEATRFTEHVRWGYTLARTPA